MPERENIKKKYIKIWMGMNFDLTDSIPLVSLPAYE
jgi:hypothetical protein